MKIVYIVRHGATEHNVTKRFNNLDTPLSESGESQAFDIAKRFKKIDIDVIISSSLTRAKQTGEIVSERTGIKHESSDLFVEGLYSAKALGRSFDEPEIREIIREFYENFTNKGFRQDGGENFEDLKRRALSALKYLENRKEGSILVISHGFFIWILAAAVMFGPELTAEECLGALRGLDLMENTGITIFTHNAPHRKAMGEPTPPWQLKVWNDHAHLG